MSAKRILSGLSTFEGCGNRTLEEFLRRIVFIREDPADEQAR
jgi:hypothetical protein